MTRPRPGQGGRFSGPLGRQTPHPPPGVFLGQQQGPRQDYDPGRKHGPAGGGVQNPYTGAGIDPHLSPGHFCTQDLVWSLGAAPNILRAGGGFTRRALIFVSFGIGCSGALKLASPALNPVLSTPPKRIGNVRPGPAEDVPLPSGTHANLTQSPSPPSKNSHGHHAPSWQTPGRASKSRMCGCKKLSWQRIREP